MVSSHFTYTIRYHINRSKVICLKACYDSETNANTQYNLKCFIWIRNIISGLVGVKHHFCIHKFLVLQNWHIRFGLVEIDIQKPWKFILCRQSSTNTCYYASLCLLLRNYSFAICWFYIYSLCLDISWCLFWRLSTCFLMDWFLSILFLKPHSRLC